MPDIVPPSKTIIHVSLSKLRAEYLHTFYYKCVHITTMEYRHISGFILYEKEEKFYLSSGLILNVCDVRYMTCRELSTFFVVDHNETLNLKNRAWKNLPVELITLCMTFARDVTDLTLWRGVSKSISAALPFAVGSIDCLDMRHLGGRCWNIKGNRESFPIYNVVKFYKGHTIRHISLPREFYVNSDELKTILSLPKGLTMLTFWFSSLFLRRVFKGGPVWSNTVETIRIIGMGINRSSLNSQILKSMKDHMPNLTTVIIDYSNFFSAHPTDLMRTAEIYGIRLEFGPYFDALGSVDSVEKMEYAIDTLRIDPSLHFHETFHLRQTRATNLLDLAVVKSPYPQREDIFFYLADRGASIRDCVNRYAWWSVIASQDCKRDMEIFSSIARKQTNRLMSPVMLESISKLRDIRDIDEKEVARLFFDCLPADIFSEPENMFRIVCFNSPHYHDFMLRIIKEYASPRLLECCNGERETVLTLAIRNSCLSDMDLMNFIDPSLPYKNSLFGSDKNTYLHLAVQYDRPRLVDALLTAHKVKINVYNHEGDTPLHVATRAKHYHIVNLLLFHGASRSATSLKDKKTAWEIAHDAGGAMTMLIPPQLEPSTMRRSKRKRSENAAVTSSIEDPVNSGVVSQATAASTGTKEKIVKKRRVAKEESVVTVNGTSSLHDNGGAERDRLETG
mmetsp:Transcript_11238/g.42064  ORF Transcript_11238/g.42064 Transcript_11238/m.42064 type:complete len:678 (-) Transcript_11238:367-2400(-)